MLKIYNKTITEHWDKYNYDVLVLNGNGDSAPEWSSGVTTGAELVGLMAFGFFQS